MPAWNGNNIICAHSDLATRLLQILIPTTFNSLICVKKGNLHFSHVLKDDLLTGDLLITSKKVKIEDFVDPINNGMC